MTIAPPWIDLFYQELVRISGTVAPASSNRTAIDLIYAKLAEISGTAGVTGAQSYKELIYRKLVEISGVTPPTNSGQTAIDLIYIALSQIGTAAGIFSFSLTPVFDADFDTVYISNVITVTKTPVAVAISITGGTYSKNGGSYTSSPGTVVDADTVTVRATSGSGLGDVTTASLTIGAATGDFVISTSVGDDVPDAFSFVDVTDATFNTAYVSNGITILAVNVAIDISITGGEYSKNGGSYTASDGTAVENDTITVRVTSGVTEGAVVSAIFTAGGVSDTYSVTTVTPVLDRVSVAPVAAWSCGRVLKTGKTARSGTPESLTQVLDQIGTNHATPVGFTALATDTIVGQSLPEAWGLNYANFDNTNDHLALTSDITIGSAFTLAFSAGVISASEKAVIGKLVNNAPFVKISTDSCQVRGTFATVTATGTWLLPVQFNYFIVTYDGATINVYVNASDTDGTPVLWATTTAGGNVGILNDIGSNQSGNFFSGGMGEWVLWNQALGATDLATIMKSGEIAWRSSYYVDPDASDNTGVGWSSATAKANFDEIGVTGTRICKPGFKAKVKRGATNTISRGHPFFITGSGTTQSGTVSKPNKVESFGTGNAMEIRMSKLAAGPWSNVSGTTYSMTWAQAAERVYWLKAGYSPEALSTACDTEYANNPPNFGSSGITDLIEFLAPGTTGGAQAAKTAYYDSGASKLYVNIGIDPTGETLEVPDQTSAGAVASNGRGISVSRVYWQVSGVNASFCVDDDLVIAGSNVTFGQSASETIIAVGGVADSFGGKGGPDNHTLNYVVAIGSGTGYDADGSNGDGFSEHGGAGHVFTGCKSYFSGKAGFDHVFHAGPITHTNCRAAGSPTNFWCAAFDDSPATRSYIDCEGKHTQVVSDLGIENPMFTCDGEVGVPTVVTINIQGGTFRGYDSDSTFVGLTTFSHAQVTVDTTGLTKSSFGHNYSNSSSVGGTLTVDGVLQ